MKIYQCLTAKGKPKGVWHILDDKNPFARPGEYIVCLCRSGNFWIGGYHRDKPPTPPEIIEYTEAHHDALCPACVLRAFQRRIVRIMEVP
jgi:hypothetical protein